MTIKKLLRLAPLILGMICSGCVSELPAPSGEVWNWVISTKSDESHSYADALKDRIQAEFGSRLPMTVREFDDMLEAQNFNCNLASPWKSGIGAVNTYECVYFQRGPTQENACVAGKDVAISISYSYRNTDEISNITTFNTRVITGPDASANNSGICFPL